MVRKLEPYIIASWHGHRNDTDIPAAVKAVWDEKFKAQRGRAPGRQSNVDIAILDSRGSLVHSFDAANHQQYGRRGRIESYTADELSRAASTLGLEKRPTKTPALKLPDLQGKQGVRVLVSLDDERMHAYRAPVVEVVPVEDGDWDRLAWPEEARRVSSSVLLPYLSQIYPPGVMERTNPATKEVYGIKAVEGELELSPVASKKGPRHAILRGEVRLVDEGPDDFGFKGTLEIVLAYRDGESTPHALRGYFDGLYPRSDRMHRDTRWLPLQAAIESFPE
ncbi:MAG: hypothetical protein VCG02_11735 [Verrucomicrobiota bacterium]